jgi:hypothetical protein
MDQGLGAGQSHRRNQSQKSVDWQFATNDARTKLKRLYPQVQAS